jgi:cytokinin riboside 5'-monophosphate phosphoribohydrolase
MEENQEKFAPESSGGDGGGSVRTICVFCGSRPGNRPSFSAAALDLGKQLVSESHVSANYFNSSANVFQMLA